MIFLAGFPLTGLSSTLFRNFSCASLNHLLSKALVSAEVSLKSCIVQQIYRPGAGIWYVPGAGAGAGLPLAGGGQLQQRGHTQQQESYQGGRRGHPVPPASLQHRLGSWGHE